VMGLQVYATTPGKLLIILKRKIWLYAFPIRKMNTKARVVAYGGNTSSWEAEARESGV
jgi:hypothetical protein